MLRAFFHFGDKTCWKFSPFLASYHSAVITLRQKRSKIYFSLFSLMLELFRLESETISRLLPGRCDDERLAFSTVASQKRHQVEETGFPSISTHCSESTIPDRVKKRKPDILPLRAFQYHTTQRSLAFTP